MLMRCAECVLEDVCRRFYSNKILKDDEHMRLHTLLVQQSSENVDFISGNQSRGKEREKEGSGQAPLRLFVCLGLHEIPADGRTGNAIRFLSLFRLN
jgi:hypothetical protein